MPPPEPPALMPQPAKCLHCGYMRDPVPLQPRCPECGHEYPVYGDTERWLLRSVTSLRRSWITMVISESITLTAFVLSLRLPGYMCLLLPTLIVTFFTALFVTQRVFSPDRATSMAYEVGTEYTRGLYDDARRRARIVLIAGVSVLAVVLIGLAVT